MPFGLETKELIIFVAGLIVAAMMSYIFYTKGLYRKQLSYSVSTKNLVFRTRDYPSDLRITYGDREITNLVRCTVYIWNSGNQPIVNSDLETKAPLKFSVEGATTVLQSSILTQSRAANNVRLSGLMPQFDYLNIGDGFATDIFVEPIKGDGVAIRLGGEIIGADREPNEVDFDFGSGFLPPIQTLLIGLVIATFTGPIFYRMVLASQAEATTVLNVARTASVGLLSVFGIALVFSELASEI